MQPVRGQLVLMNLVVGICTTALTILRVCHNAVNGVDPYAKNKKFATGFSVLGFDTVHSSTNIDNVKSHLSCHSVENVCTVLVPQ